MGDDPSDFSVYLGRHSVCCLLTDPNTGGTLGASTAISVAGTGSDTIQFAFRDDPPAAYLALDNVSVSQSGGTGTTPEPSSFILMGSGVLALGGMVRRET